MEFKTVKYCNDARGMREKDEEANRCAQFGWKIQSETIEPGKFRTGDAFCLSLLSLPCALLAGHSPGNIVVTYYKE